jgi:hypothetical protein
MLVLRLRVLRKMLIATMTRIRKAIILTRLRHGLASLATRGIVTLVLRSAVAAVRARRFRRARVRILRTRVRSVALVLLLVLLLGGRFTRIAHILKEGLLMRTAAGTAVVRIGMATRLMIVVARVTLRTMISTMVFAS